MRRIVLALAAILAMTALRARGDEVSVNGLNLDRTLRVNYIFTGTDKEQEISLAELCSIEGWAGRRVNMDKVPLKGNGQVVLSVRS